MIDELIKKQTHLTPLEEQIATYFLNVESDLKSTRNVAKNLYTTPSTIVRFCQKLGFKGFNDFKDALINERNLPASSRINYNYPFDSNDKTTHLSHKIGELYHHHIKDTLIDLRHDDLSKALNMISAAQQIIIISSGIQANLASNFQDKMLKIGKDVVIEYSLDHAYFRACHQDHTTLFIIISYSGQTPVTLKVANKIHERHLPLLSITSQSDNELSQLSHLSLFVSTKETLIDNLGHFGMNISLLLLLDILYALYFNQNYESHLENRIEVTKGFQTERKSDHPLLK